MSATTAGMAVPRRAGGPTSLTEELRYFCGQTNPKLMAATVALAVAARVALGGWAGGDAVAVVALLAVQPFFEWTFHVYVLHYRPLRLFGRTIDFELARKHREHHADPANVELVFVPLRSLVIAMIVFSTLSLVLLPSLQTALTAMAGGAVLLLAYEWTHYLIHSRYRPKTRVFRALWRAHRLHHYKNEQYWFGVTNPAADYVLRTTPSPGDVETSPTARDLAAR